MSNPFFPSSSGWFQVLSIISLTLFTLFLLVKLKKKSTTKGLNLPPRPPGLPIIGNLHQIGKLPHLSLYKLSQKHGPIMLVQLGSIPTLVVSSFDMAKEVLKTHDRDCCNRYASPGATKLSYGCVDVVFGAYTSDWKNMRKIMVNELLGAKREQSLRKAREEEISHFMNSLLLDSPNTVNLNEKIFSVVDGIIGTVAYGKSYRGKQFRNQNIQDVLDEAMSLLAFSAEDFFPKFGWIVDGLTGLHGRLDKNFHDIDDYLQMVIDHHLDPARVVQPEDEDFVDVLIRLSREHNAEFPITKERIKALLTNTFLGGIDTSVITMIWAMTELIKNPRVLKKVQYEIRSCIGMKEILNEDDVEKLHYLKMVLKETLRLHPPVPLLIQRQSIRHFRIGDDNINYDVPPKTSILVNIWAIGKDPKIWTNPHDFYPERFENSEIDYKGQHFELLPFGGGRRICPGLKMAVPTMELILGNLLYCFDWELPNGMKREDINMEEQGAFTTNKKVPLYLVPIKYWQG